VVTTAEKANIKEIVDVANKLSPAERDALVKIGKTLLFIQEVTNEAKQ